MTATTGFVTKIQATPISGGFETAEGTPYQKNFSGATSQIAAVVMFTETVPLGETWRLRRVSSHARTYGVTTILVNGILSGKIISSPTNENGIYDFLPYIAANSGQIISIEFLQSHGPVADLFGFFQYTKI